MTFERWGTFSVMDHRRQRAFVADVLLYDKLVIPTPPDDQERARWKDHKWDPDGLDRQLEILGPLAKPMIWGKPQQEEFRTRLAAATAANAQVNYGLTPIVLMEELKRQHEEGPPLRKTYIVPAYPSYLEFKKEVSKVSKDTIDVIKSSTISVVLAHRFLVPKRGNRTDLELLREAVDLAKDDEFKEKRRQLYIWQESVITRNYTYSQAIEEMNTYLSQYEQLVKKAWKNVSWKFAITLMVASSGIVGAAVGSPFAIVPLSAAGVGAFATLADFLKFDSSPVVPQKECAPAAMLHTVQERFGTS